MARQKLVSVDDDPKFGNQFICTGYHAYSGYHTCNPALGQELILKPESSNYKDKHAVAGLKDDVIVEHIPYNLAPRLS